MTSVQMNSYLHSEISRKFPAKLSVLKSICGPMNKKMKRPLLALHILGAVVGKIGGIFIINLSNHNITISFQNRSIVFWY